MPETNIATLGSCVRHHHSHRQRKKAVIFNHKIGSKVVFLKKEL